MRFPVSAILFAASVVWFLLQAIPGFGFILMLIAAPMWSIILINGAIIGAGIEALIGRIHLVWLAVPVAWFTGYGVYMSAEHKELAAFKEEARVANAQVRIPFSPKTHALLVEKGDVRLIGVYDIPVVYSYRIFNNRTGTVSTRIGSRRKCDSIRQNKTYDKANINTWGFHDDVGIGKSKVFVKDFCLVNIPEKISGKVFKITSSEQEIERGSLPVRFVTTTIKTPEGAEHALKQGWTSPLKWFPQPMLGCFHDINAKTDCGFWFRRASWVPLVDGELSKFDGQEAALAAALGLSRVRLKNRKAASDATIETALSRALDLNTERTAQDVTKQLAWLDLVLKDPIKYRTATRGFDSLNGKSDLLKPRLPKMMDAIERGASNYGPEGGNAVDILRLLETLTYADVEQYLNRLSKVSERPAFKFKVPQKR